MNDEQLMALLGFAFAAAWAGFGFGEALLCLVAAGAFYAVARFMSGDLDVGNVRERLEGARSGFHRPRDPGAGGRPGGAPDGGRGAGSARVR